MLKVERLSVLIGSIVVIVSIVVAVLIHPTRVYCSYTGKVPPPCPQPNSVWALRIGIIVAGLVIATLILVLMRKWAARRSAQSDSAERSGG